MKRLFTAFALALVLAIPASSFAATDFSHSGAATQKSKRTSKKTAKSKAESPETKKNKADEKASSTPPKGATALCNDGTYSFSKTRSGTCSHHKGVKTWLQNGSEDDAQAGTPVYDPSRTR